MRDKLLELARETRGPRGWAAGQLNQSQSSPLGWCRASRSFFFGLGGQEGTKSGNWIGDHQPPSRMAGGGPQALYPHCQTCSNAQGLWIINLIRRGLL